MPWPVIPFSQLTGVSGRFYPTYLRWPPENLQVLVVGGGGSGVWEGGGGGGGILDFSYSTKVLPGGQASIPIAAGGPGQNSSFSTAYVATAGGNSREGGGAGDYSAGTGGSPPGNRGGGWYHYGVVWGGGGGGAYSAVGGDARFQNDFYSGDGREGYTVSAGFANALGGQTVLGSSGAGGFRAPSYYKVYGYNVRLGTAGTGAGKGGYGGATAVGDRAGNGSWYGSGGGGPGGTGRQGVVVVSYPGTQASPSGTVSSYGGYTYHVFTAASATLEL